MAEKNEMNTQGAQLDFVCTDANCNGIVKFNLMDLETADFQAMCPKCHRPYAFDPQLKEKFMKLHKLILALRDAEPILGDCNVGVAVPAGEVKIPYALLLTRLKIEQRHGFDDEPSPDIPEIEYEWIGVNAPWLYGFCDFRRPRRPTEPVYVSHHGRYVRGNYYRRTFAHHRI